MHDGDEGMATGGAAEIIRRCELLLGLFQDTSRFQERSIC